MNAQDDDGFLEAAARVLPHNTEAERAALGSVFIKPIAFEQLAGAVRGADDFFHPAHREIFDAMVAVKKRKRPLDVIEVADELKRHGHLSRLEGGQSYLNDLANATPTGENVEHYARIVREKATLRMLIAVCAEVQSTAYGDFGEHEEFVTESVRKVAAVAMRDQRRKRKGLDAIEDELLRRLELTEIGKVVSRVPTGIARLDRLLRGGLSREHLVVPCGLTSMGKSSWAFQVAFRAAEERHIPVLIFSLEMSREEAFVKGASLLSRTPTDLFYPEPRERLDWDQLHAIAGRASQLKHLVRIEEHRSIGELVAVAHAWRAELPVEEDGTPCLAMVVADHIQKIQGVRAKNANRQEEVWGVAQELKNLAKDLKLPVVAPAQLDNDAAKERRAPKIGDIRDSKAIEHEADVIIGIHRDRLKAQGSCELIVLKQRGGSVGKRTVQWHGPYQGFEDPPADMPNDDEDPVDFSS